MKYWENTIKNTHAKLLKNEYRKTKREIELIIETYALKHKIPPCIYRLPPVFGEDCKPNHNFVVSTWMFNSINGLEINVFDRDIKMIYLQDIVKEVIDMLNGDKSNTLYIEPYDTTLGEIVDFIQEFQENILDKNYQIEGLTFKKKMFNTYKDYHRNKNVK